MSMRSKFCRVVGILLNSKLRKIEYPTIWPIMSSVSSMIHEHSLQCTFYNIFLICMHIFAVLPQVLIVRPSLCLNCTYLQNYLVILFWPLVGIHQFEWFESLEWIQNDLRICITYLRKNDKAATRHCLMSSLENNFHKWKSNKPQIFEFYFNIKLLLKKFPECIIRNRKSIKRNWNCMA